MLSTYLPWILYVTGAITSAAGLQYLFPELMLKLLSKLEIKDAGGLFYARHWGLLAAMTGGLLIYAGGHAEIRTPILAAAAFEKLGLVALIASQWKQAHTQGMRLTAVFDAGCSALYLLALFA